MKLSWDELISLIQLVASDLAGKNKRNEDAAEVVALLHKLQAVRTATMHR